MSIRAKLFLMLALPLLGIALVGTIGFRSQSSSAIEASQALEADDLVQNLNRTIKAIGAERLAIASGADGEELAELQDITDMSLAATSDAVLEESVSTTRNAVVGATNDVLNARDLDALPRVVEAYNDATVSLREVRDDVPVRYPSQESFAEAASVDLAVDIADRQDAIWLEYFAADQISPSLASRVRSEAAATSLIREQIVDIAPEQHIAELNATRAGDSDLTLARLAVTAVDRAQSGFSPVPDAEVLPAITESHEDWYGHAITLQTDVVNELTALSEDAEGRQNLFAMLGIFGLIVLAGLIYVVYRSVVHPLNQLLAGAEAVANDHLPSAVAQLRTIGSSDAGVHLDPLPREHDDEVGALVDAFNDVQLTAFDLAVEQARSRRNIAEMFVNLGRRNQKLLQRMLDVISDLEHDEQNAGKLEQLFELDHMTTRMRRNAESLLVVAGTTSPRQWTKPVPAADVVRSALAEVQDYHRIDILTLAEAPMPGNAIADVTHLLAELLENSLQFSEPESRVSVSSRWADGNYRIVITDQGFGMSAQELAENNALIANPPPPDQAPTRFLGLFVVGHLAKRHNIDVRLTDATIGGTDARITIPASMMTEKAATNSALNTGADLPTRDAGADEVFDADTHLDLDAELAKLTAETESQRSAEAAADEPFTESVAPADMGTEVPTPSGDSDLPVRGDSDLPVRGGVETFTGAVTEAPVSPQAVEVAEVDASQRPLNETFATATSAPAAPDANPFTSASSDLPVRGEANIDFGEMPDLPSLEKLPPRPPSSIGDLPVREQAGAAMASAAVIDTPPAPAAAPAPAAPAPVATVASSGLPQRTPRATLQEVSGAPVAPLAAPEPAAVEDTSPQDVTSAAANVGTMFSAFQAGVQRGEQKTN